MAKQNTTIHVSRQALCTEIRCECCRASLTIETDSRRAAERSLARFRKHHHCRRDRTGG